MPIPTEHASEIGFGMCHSNVLEKPLPHEKSALLLMSFERQMNLVIVEATWMSALSCRAKQQEAIELSLHYRKPQDVHHPDAESTHNAACLPVLWFALGKLLCNLETNCKTGRSPEWQPWRLVTLFWIGTIHPTTSTFYLSFPPHSSVWTNEASVSLEKKCFELKCFWLVLVRLTNLQVGAGTLPELRLICRFQSSVSMTEMAALEGEPYVHMPVELPSLLKHHPPQEPPCISRNFFPTLELETLCLLESFFFLWCFLSDWLGVGLREKKIDQISSQMEKTNSYEYPFLKNCISENP